MRVKETRKGLLIGLVVIMAFLLLVAFPSSSRNGTTPASSSSSSSSQSSENSEVKAEFKKGDAVKDGTFEFAVITFVCGMSQAANDNEFETVTAQGQFCGMSLNIENIGNEAQTFESSAQYVYGSDGKRFSSSTDGTMASSPSGTDCNYPI